MSTLIEVHHQMVKATSSFDDFTRQLEAALGRFDPTVLQKAGTEPTVVAAQLKAMEGEQGLMLFNIEDHGQALAVVGAPRKARQYVLGNPLIAMSMTRLDLRAALYAPLHVLVYEAPDQAVYIEYDLPSSLFGQFGNAAVTEVAQELDEKVVKLLAKADQ